MTAPIDIIVPVYGGVEQTRRCLESVLAHPQAVPCHLLVIEDASPDPAMRPMLETLAAEHPERITLLHNPTNLGFVGTVNRGMALHPDRDVVLLNSDTEVANDWLDRLHAAAHSHPRVATVTPFSNNATICSLPRCCHDNPLPPGVTLAEIDRACAHANAGATVEIPTGVGFCLYITRACLDAVGLFDAERFGRGYGEENDFCRRAAAAGWINLLACDTFVFHEGGVSFSSEQQERIERAQQILDRLYPDYHALVQAHIQADPAAPHRLAALAALYHRSERPVVLHLSHHLGGGTQSHVEELATYVAEKAHSLLLIPAGEGRVALHFGATPDDPRLIFALPEHYPKLLELMRALGVGRVHVHHTLGLETSTWRLADDLGVPLWITLHDYYFVNAHPAQTDAQGRYQPDPDRQAARYPLPVSLDEWQRNQRRLLERAERIIAPSQAAKEVFEAHYPDLEVTVAFHPDSERQMPWPAVCNPWSGDGELRVLVLGALSLEKGAELLEAVARLARRQAPWLRFHLLGYPCRPLDGAVQVHGAYRPGQLPERIATIDPHLIWYPALWPETYSYTLSEGLATGLPMVVPDLGAFAERVTGRPLTRVVPWDQPPETWLALFEAFAGELAAAGSGPHPWPDQPRGPHPDFYTRGYAEELTRPAPGPLPDRATLSEWLAVSRSLASPHQGRRERLLRWLVSLRASPPGRLLGRLVPLEIQRRIKRRLSSRPLHELDGP